MTALLTALVFVLLVVVVWQWREIRRVRATRYNGALNMARNTRRQLDAIYDQRWRTKDDQAARELYSQKSVAKAGGRLGPS